LQERFTTQESAAKHRPSIQDTAAVTTTISTFKIEDPSRGPGRVDFRAPDEASVFEGTPKPKIQRDPSLPRRKPCTWYAAVTFRLGSPKLAEAKVSNFSGSKGGAGCLAPLTEAQALTCRSATHCEADHANVKCNMYFGTQS
jgi:hypothetical protein